MATTHGGKAVEFGWLYQENQLLIKIKDGKTHNYTLQEITKILSTLLFEFGHDWFPLANNVQKMYEQNEKPGLGSTIYALRPGDTYHAQGASYLGVVLEEAGIFEWNGKIKGIEWRIVAGGLDSDSLRKALEEARRDKGRLGDKVSVPNKNISTSIALELTVGDLANMRRRLIQVLNAVEGAVGQQEGLGSRVRRLTHSDKIPREIAAFMLVVSEARNVTEYQAKRLSSTEAEAVRNAWKAILEWAYLKGITVGSKR